MLHLYMEEKKGKISNFRKNNLEIEYSGDGNTQLKIETKLGNSCIII